MRQLVKRQIVFDQENPKYYYEFAGDSNENKPTEDVATGSKFHEVDTAMIYAFLETGTTWYPQIDLGGGS